MSDGANPQRLERGLTLWPIVLFGLAYITPFIVITTFGVFSEVSKGTLPSSYLVAGVAMIFTALSYGKMAKEFPFAGSVYTYVRKTIDARVGFLAGWAVLLDYFFLPMVVWLFGTVYLKAQFPSVPSWVFLVGFILLTTILNVLGIKLATRVNAGLLTFQMLILLFFIFFSLHRVLGASGTGFTFAPFWNSATTLGAISSGAALAAYSFIGFDAVSTFSEEAVDPRKTIPRAILLTASAAAVIFVIVSYVIQLVHPGGTFTDSSTAPLDIAKSIGGDFFGSVFLATVILAQFTAGIPIQAAGARLMFAMGRDNVLPKKFFAYVSPRYRTPVINLVLIGGVGLIALGLNVSTSTSFINFGAFTAFAMVNISVIALYFRERKLHHRNWISWIVQPLIGLAVIIWMLFHLDWRALTLGAVWVVLGFIWLLVLTKGFKVTPPEMDFKEVEELEESR